MSQVDPSSVTTSTKSFFSAVIGSTALLLIEVSLFLLLKQRLERIYSPRTYLPPPEKRSPKLPPGPWKWLPDILNSRAEDIIDKNGLDAYMFLRFLKMLVCIFLVFTVLTFAVIVPVDFIGQNGAKSSLERITWTNVTDAKEQKRFTAHIIVVYILTSRYLFPIKFFVIYLVRREMSHFVLMRQRFLLNPAHSRLAQARTVLITSVPDTLSTESSLRQFASFVPGGVERVWFYRDTKKLNKLFNERSKKCNMLETAVSEILRDAMKAWRKREDKRKKKKAKNIPKPRSDDVEGGQGREEPLDDDEELLEQEVSQKLLDELVPPAKRPKHRVDFIGEKVDTIDWCRDEIAKLNSNINSMRASPTEEGKFLGSVFILCNLQIGAHILAQCVSYHQVLQMNDKFIETHPADIVWHNLDDDALETRSKVALSWVATIGLIILWSFPVALIGGLSNVNSVCKKVAWLQWICRAPPTVQSIVQGLLPPVLLAALFATMPVILRGLAWYEGLPRYSLISVSLYRRFFLFLLIHGFLIVTLSAGMTKVIGEIIDNPTHTVQDLAQHLPSASVFFLTYLVTQGLAGAGIALSQLFPLLSYYFGKWFKGRTPREAFNVTFLMPSADFGKLLPRLSLLATIGLAYSVLNPLINLLAFICFGCYYIAWKFLFIQVFDQPAARESGGGYFPMAASNLCLSDFTLNKSALASLFFLKVSVAEARFVALAQGIMMLILVALTVWAHVLLNRSFAPLTKYLPMSLATKALADRFSTEGSGEVDLFSKDFVRDIQKRMGKIPDRSTFQTFTARVKSSFNGASSSRGDLEEGNGSNNGVGSSDPAALSSDDASAQLPDDSAQTSEQAPNVAANASGDPTQIPQELEGQNNENHAPEDSLDKHAFDHPSTYVEQPCIWIPKDTLGLCRVLVEYLEEAGVSASDEGASMDVKGVVEVTSAPPGLSSSPSDMGKFPSYISHNFPPTPTYSIDQIPDLTGQVIIATGSNTGIGKLVVEQLLKNNAKVYMAVRSQEKALAAIKELKEKTGKEAIFLKLDLSDLTTIRSTVEDFLSKETQLHVLMNNAGVSGPPNNAVTAQGYELRFGTNTLGHFYFTTLLFPILASTAKTTPGHKVRVVHTSSWAHHHYPKMNYSSFKDGPARNKMDWLALYGQSKTGNILFSNELAKRYGDQGIVSISIHPGSVRTELNRSLPLVMRSIMEYALFYPTALGALTPLYAATAPECADYNGLVCSSLLVDFHSPTSCTQYITAWARLDRSEPNPQVSDPAEARQLWEYMEEQVKDY
ncbi:DUF221-domain-containing protein [Gymnopus androsaceus JB14]|uniref:DUF221-domain-containing protein n=1 Tax=Gymnopus androsaceus JB14 TaxID=1447944 RepID=A0A6A4HQ17_9AGAR|nr:DUF221-domain-containing protein [Gymnopus androsaceus JB14]